MAIPTVYFDCESIKIINLGDVHRGNKYHASKEFEAMVEYIKGDDEAYWISTGDILEMAIKASRVADVYSSKAPFDEFNEIVELLSPIAHKCLGIVGSNHHDRLEKETSFNVDELLCKTMGLPYLGDMGVMRTVVNGVGWYHLLHHNWGGGRKRGSKANNLISVGDLVRGCDIVWAGHTHTYSYFPEMETYLDRKHVSVIKRTTHYLNTGHYLKPYEINRKGSYAVKKGFKATGVGSAMATLYAKGKNYKYQTFEFLDVEGVRWKKTG